MFPRYNFSNLYGWAMSQKMPMRDFKWVDPEIVAKVTTEHIAKLHPNGKNGYIFEIDAEIPHKLQDRYYIPCVCILVVYS